MDMSSFSNGESSAPAFYRLNSEVVEKPSTSGDERHEYLAVPSSSPIPRASYQGPCSPAHSSSKDESEVGESWWSVLPSWGGQEEGTDVTVSSGDGLLDFSLCLTGSLSDGELEEQGEVDEGFDEEFEEKDLNESESNSHQHLPSLEMEELDPKDLQQLLGMELDLAGLEDFDLGVDVDVLDNDEEHFILSPLPPSNPISCIASPAHFSFTQSPPPFVDLHVETNQRDEETNGEGPVSVQSYVSGGEGIADYNTEDREIQYNEEQLALLVSECRVVPESTTNDHSHLMDLTETFVLAVAAVLPPAIDSTSTDLHSMLLFGNGSGQLGPPPNTTVDPSSSNTDSVGPVTYQMTTLADSSLLPTLDMSSSLPHVNTELHSGRLYCPLSPVGSPSLSTTSTFITTSPPPSPSLSLENNTFSHEEKKLIDMQYYQFKKLLDDPSIAEKKKEVMKSIRRKGKNKFAAKVCRQKKVHKVKGLEQEIEQLKKTKLLMTLRQNSLEHEITQLKRQCHHQI